jgi:hypothetical protein
MKRKATQTKATTAKKVKVELRVETREEIPHAQVTVTDPLFNLLRCLGMEEGRSASLQINTHQKRSSLHHWNSFLM